MTTLSQGANVSLGSVASQHSTVVVHISWSPATIGGRSVDSSAFVLGSNGKVLGDDYFVFYNQPQSADGAVKATPETGGMRFSIDLPKINGNTDKIAFVATIDGQGVSFGSAQSATMTLRAPSGDVLATFDAGTAGRQEAALIFGELYKRNGDWKLRAVGQGFNGGLKPLAEHYGVVVDDEPAAPAAPAAPSSAVRLEKKLIDLQKKDPSMVSLVKKVQVQIEKKGLKQDRAKVALVLDVSPSMAGFFDNGSVNELVRRVLALGLRFDDDGEIDVFLFGQTADVFGTVTIDNYRGFVQTVLDRHGYSPGTYYGRAMKLLRETYKAQPDFGSLPVYIMFVTDGATQDPANSETHIRESSHEPFFWKFLAIGAAPQKKKKKKSKWDKIFGSGFEFLEKLDDLPGRLIDNADFQPVQDPSTISEDEMFELLMEEYPEWVNAAQSQGLIRG